MENKITIAQVVQHRDGSLGIDGIRELEIKPLKVFQSVKVTKKIHEIIFELNKDENISGALSGMFDGADQGLELNEVLQNATSQFIKDSAGSIGLLIELVPEKTLELIAILADMPVDELMMQDLEVFFDIADKVIEVNDIQKIVERANLSLGSLFKKMGWKFLTNQATTPKVIK